MQIFLKTEKKPLFSKISGYLWTGKNDLKTLRWTQIFSKTGEKKLCFQKYPDTCGHFIKSKRLNRLAMFCCLGQFFETPTKFYLHLIQFMIMYIGPFVGCRKHLLFHSNYKVFKHGTIKHGRSGKKITQSQVLH